jgi:hypothetical protein
MLRTTIPLSTQLMEAPNASLQYIAGRLDCDSTISAVDRVRQSVFIDTASNLAKMSDAGLSRVAVTLNIIPDGRSREQVMRYIDERRDTVTIPHVSMLRSANKQFLHDLLISTGLAVKPTDFANASTDDMVQLLTFLAGNGRSTVH